MPVSVYHLVFKRFHCVGAMNRDFAVIVHFSNRPATIMVSRDSKPLTPPSVRPVLFDVFFSHGIKIAEQAHAEQRRFAPCLSSVVLAIKRERFLHRPLIVILVPLDNDPSINRESAFTLVTVARHVRQVAL